MKPALLPVALAAGFATAQLDDVPGCAHPCVNEYMSGGKIAGCGSFNVKCVCSNDDFINSIACCVADKCDQSGQDDTINFARQICSTQGVTVPDKVVCKKSSESSSSATTPTASGTQEPTATKTDSSSKDTDKPDAAPGSLSGMGGVVGAAVAMLFAL